MSETNISSLFPQSYEASRDRFRHNLDRVQTRWPNARLERYRVEGNEDTTIDWLQAQGQQRNEKLLVFTTGLHGMEGYVGSAVLQLFVQEILPQLGPTCTGLLLVHAINPWGMKHRRRTNSKNVDLNRNFADSLGRFINPDYGKLDSFLNPQRPIRNLFWDNVSFFLQLVYRLLFLGPGRIQRAALLGQYRFPMGIYYGGDSIQEETQVLINLYREHLQQYRQIVLLDMHTGYGPRYQMSLVNSPLEPKTSEELEQLFGYPRVITADPAEFFSMQGDMLDYVHTLVRDEFPGKDLYTVSFEFGTLGDALPATIRTLRTTIQENQMYWFGAKNQRVQKQVERDYAALYIPQEERWRLKAMADARQAIQGILRAKGFLYP
jgi:predicted deacylase